MNTILLFPLGNEINYKKMVPLITLIFLITLYFVDQESAINLAFTPSLSTLTNIKQNKLSLKALQEKLDKLEKLSNNKESENINIRVRKGVAPIYLILSTILTYAHKIPVINKLTGYITKRYGRTKWYEYLIYLRKLFIIINAIIGVFTVFKVSGYGYDNFICGLYGLGNTYVEIFSSFVKRIFVFVLDLLDIKVIPNIPKSPPSNNSWWPFGAKESTWYTKPMVHDGLGKIIDLSQNQDFYKGPFSNNTGSTSTWSWTSVLWYGSIALITLGTLYLGFKIYSDITHPIDKGKGVDFSNYPDHPGNTNTNTITQVIGSVATGLFSINKTIISYLNPYNYMEDPLDIAEAKEIFTSRQQSANHYNSKYWPYTSNNPFDSYFKKWRISILGETYYEEELRNNVAESFRNNMYSISKPHAESSAIPHKHGSLTPIGVGATPIISDNSLVDAVNVANISHKLNSLPTTPNEWSADSTSISREQAIAIERINTPPSTSPDASPATSARSITPVQETVVLNSPTLSESTVVASNQPPVIIDEAKYDEYIPILSKIVNDENKEATFKAGRFRRFFDEILYVSQYHNNPVQFRSKYALHFNNEIFAKAYPEFKGDISMTKFINGVNVQFNTYLPMPPNMGQDELREHCLGLIKQNFNQLDSNNCMEIRFRAMKKEIFKTAFPDVNKFNLRNFMRDPAHYLGKEFMNDLRERFFAANKK